MDEGCMCQCPTLSPGDMLLQPAFVWWGWEKGSATLLQLRFPLISDNGAQGLG